MTGPLHRGAEPGGAAASMFSEQRPKKVFLNRGSELITRSGAAAVPSVTLAATFSMEPKACSVNRQMNKLFLLS